MSDILTAAADALDPRPNPYMGRPADWIGERLGESLTYRQKGICSSLVENRFTAVKSAHSTGKSHLASRLATYWVDAHPPEETFIVSTAPSANQVEGILWRYIDAAHEEHDLPGRVTTGGGVPTWKTDTGRLIGWGRKPPDLTSPEQAATVFQGIHAKYVLVLIDEAGGIPKWLWDAVNTIVTSAHCRVVAIGNPDDPSSHFASVCAPGTKWNVITIDAFCSPNYIGSPLYTGSPEEAAHDILLPESVKEQLVGPIFVEEAESDWGVESPLYIAKVKAEFPDRSDDMLIPMAWINQAKALDLSGEAIATQGKFALDVARSGQDEAVLGRDRGGMFRIVKSKSGINDTTILVDDWLTAVHTRHPDASIIIDADGMGGPVLDFARKARLPVSPFYAGKRAFDATKFVNRRSEQWWTLRMRFKDNLVDIDAADLKLQSQLGSIKFKELPDGRIMVETKEKMKKRGLPSPDRGDTLMMVHAPAEDWTFAYQDETGGTRKAAESVTSDLLTKEW